MNSNDWIVTGAHGELIHGTTHLPSSKQQAVALIAHGFKGYKDYGMFPWLANQLVSVGITTHRFNFSHSGMLNGAGDFERPDLFMQDTWNKQVEDLNVLSSTFCQKGLPFYLIGHSRGGASCLLSVGRGNIIPDKIISLSAPSTCLSLSLGEQKQLLSDGFLNSPSSRTGQLLQVGVNYLQEQLDSPSKHNLLHLVTKIKIPILVVHGDSDTSVPIEHGKAIANAANESLFAPIGGGNHIFNTPNPFTEFGTPSPELIAAWETIRQFV